MAVSSQKIDVIVPCFAADYLMELLNKLDDSTLEANGLDVELANSVHETLVEDYGITYDEKEQQ